MNRCLSYETSWKSRHCAGVWRVFLVYLSQLIWIRYISHPVSGIRLIKKIIDQPPCRFMALSQTSDCSKTTTISQVTQRSLSPLLSFVSMQIKSMAGKNTTVVIVLSSEYSVKNEVTNAIWNKITKILSIVFLIFAPPPREKTLGRNAIRAKIWLPCAGFRLEYGALPLTLRNW